MAKKAETVKHLPDGVTEEQLTKWKRVHGADKVFPVRVTKDGKTYVGVFRKPDLSDMSAAASVGQNNPVGSAELLYNSCKLAVDPQMDSDDEVKFGAMTGVGRMFRVLEAEVGEAFGSGQ
jgi:hypothetical protein